MVPTMKLYILAAIAAIAATACSPMHYVRGVPNLDRVDAGVLRSGQINSVDGWRYVLEVAQVPPAHLHVIKLNFDSEGSDALAAQLGIDVHVLAIQPRGDQDIWDDVLSVFKGPDPKRVHEAERLLVGASARDVWLVHCTHGQDRTGYVIGIYRVIHYRWSKARAYAEMRAHHFHPELHGLHEAWEAFNPKLWKP